MKITLVVAIVIAVLCETFCQKCFTSSSKEQPNRFDNTELYSSHQEFSLKLLHEIHRVLPDQNLFFSPHSIFHALLIAYFLTGGKTESSLKKTLGFKDNLTKQELYAIYKKEKLTQLNTKSADYVFKHANKIYIDDDIAITKCAQDGFPEEIEKKGFNTNPERARISINNWVANTTQQMIQNLIPPGTLDRTTELVLVNAAFFKREWKKQFDPKHTEREDFYLSPSRQITVDMMHTVDTFRHGIFEALGAQVLEMPFEGDTISMYIILPFSGNRNSVDTTLKNLNLDNFKKIVGDDELVSKSVDVALPKFTREVFIEMRAVLEHLGVGDLFQSTSNFSMLSEEKNVTLQQTVHKAKIEVDEHGAKAAAGSGFFSNKIGATSLPPEFFCDHPFIYFIFEKIQKSILFVGLFRGPN